MDTKDQAQGEARVQALLIDPLTRLGLARPTPLTIRDFEAMQREICQRLAYMTAEGLEALAEIALNNPGGKDGDRFPLAIKLLSWAADIEPPAQSVSPLMRSVFTSATGRAAIDGGYAPELLGWLRANRQWPRSFDIAAAQDRARDNLRRIALIADKERTARHVTDEDRAFRDRRDAAVRRCRSIAEGEA